MNINILIITLISFFIISCKTDNPQKPIIAETKKSILNLAHALISKMVDKVGTYDKWKELKDVEIKYTYHDKANDLKDISTERYLMDGEKSWAKYTHHKKFVFPDKEGDVIQGYNGVNAWVTLDGERVMAPEAIKMSDFMRKTNFYWFAMMPKLMDPGIIYNSLEDRDVDGISYKIVKVTYNANIGDVQDEYLLYINPVTDLVDQFLFTVKDFNITEPLIMKVKYKEVNGLLLPVNRTYTQSNWQGDIIGEDWVDEITEDIKFKNGFKSELFDAP